MIREGRIAPYAADAVPRPGRFGMEHPHKVNIKGNIPDNRISGSAWLLGAPAGPPPRTPGRSRPRRRKREGERDGIIRVAVMCHPASTRRRAAGDLEEAEIPARLTGKSG